MHMATEWLPQAALSLWIWHAQLIDTNIRFLSPISPLILEVTKVRRNLFNQGMLSPSKRGLKKGLPRSRSVSTLECLQHKQDKLKKTKSSTFQGN